MSRSTTNYSTERKNRKSIPIIEDIDDIKYSKTNIFLFGKIGSGKTFLINHLCEKEFETRKRGFSCTHTVQHSFTINYSMIIVDFPGLKSAKNIMLHLRMQKVALSTIPVRMICFVVKNERIDDILNQINELKKIFLNYLDNVVIIITNSEDCDKNEQKDISHIIKKKTKISNIFFTGEDTNFNKLCKDFYLLQKNMKNYPNLCISLENLVKTIDMDLVNEEIFNKPREKYIAYFNEALKIFENEIDKAKENDLKRALFLCFRNYKNWLIEDYSKYLLETDLGEVDDEDDNLDLITAEVLLYTNVITDTFNEFRNNVEKRIEVMISNLNNEYNRFKKCPYCGTIWFKVKGCEFMKCGNRTKLSDRIYGIFKDYQVSFKNKKIEIKREDLNRGIEKDAEFWGLSKEEENENERRKKEIKVQIKPIGCGQKLNWNTMEDCSEEVIKKLKENLLKDDDYFKSIEIFEKLAE